MAEPTNTPVPASTPRSASPAPPMPPSLLYSPTSPGPLPLRPAQAARKPIVLHIGDPIKYNPATYESFSAAFDVVRPSLAERQRREFMRALRERRWGDFSAVFRPFWGTGGEMGRWDEELIALLPDSVRVFASAGAGFDWADTKALAERGIIYCNSGLAAAESVADFAVAMVISTFRHLPWCMTAATADPALFESCHALATARARNPRGHALGVVGLGNIGQHLAAKLGCPAFGMRVHYTDVVRKPAALEARLGATFHPTLEGLLAASDCVVLCAPAGDGGPLITREVLAAARQGMRLVNVARGSLVDEEALADALEEGRVSAAALDVHSGEPRVNARLAKMTGPEVITAEGGGASSRPHDHPGRVMLTSHNAGGTVDSHVGFEELSMRNIMAVLSGGQAITPVNLHFLKKDDTSRL
ncbi:D-isomer specific 2-hydroxyacid dehydrogenase [Pleurostoma richardsiae]|uniref:D-isomer specific 2-hydroxyacid dehydrogenase n=1 Tax=Pleurostoma richardsiae TaxID=41990 RepID=A0AA38RGV0_9PEZI|nr:D-isomer specific 2-hydroxyacid dehydrogenase [Pleurostoma richardsiae]